MEYTELNINFHKTKLLNLINNLINTQLINQEIDINIEINKESQLLASLLNEKQKYLINQMMINNNNINNPLMFQQNQMMNAPQMDINLIQMQQPLINDNSMDNLKYLNKNKILNIYFKQLVTGDGFLIICYDNDKVSDVIEKYRQKANDYNDNHFLFNGKIINDLNYTLNEMHISEQSEIRVDRRGYLKGGK